jgi:hypothetical protein
VNDHRTVSEGWSDVEKWHVRREHCIGYVAEGFRASRSFTDHSRLRFGTAEGTLSAPFFAMGRGQSASSARRWQRR